MAIADEALLPCAEAITPYTTSHDGNIRTRRSRLPEASTTASTDTRGNARANNPTETRSARPSSTRTTCCPARPIPPNHTHATPS